MAHVQRAGRVGRDELDHDGAALARAAAAEAAPAAAWIAATTPKREARESVKLMKPGPAISVFAISGAAPRAATMACAASRGFRPTRLAICSATFVAKSPWSAFFGRSRSTVTSPASGKAVRTAWLTRSARRVLGSASVTGSASGENPLLYGPPPPGPTLPLSSPLIRWISRWRESADPHVGLDSLVAGAQPGASPERRLAWLRDLSAWVRADLGDNDEARASSQSVRLKHLLGVLDRQPERKAAFAATLRATLGRRDAFDLLIETGMPRETGFLGEFVRRLFAKLLPEPPPTDLAELFVQVFPERGDAERMSGITTENWQGVLALLGHGEGAADFRVGLAQAAGRAIEALAVQVCAATMPSVVRTRMRGDSAAPLAAWDLPEAARAFVVACAAGDQGRRAQKGEALHAVIGSSLIETEQAYTHLDDQGVSIAVVYQLERIRAQLQRAGELTELLAAPEHLPQVLPHFIASLIRDVHDQRSVLALLGQNFELAARKVVERSAETGEHYITRNRAEYRDMLAHASGGGAVLAVTTYVKFAIAALHLPQFFGGVLASLNYAATFVAIQFAGFTVATKQPAMTAPALAAQMKGLEDPARMDGFVDEVANLVRSQSASIFGNVFVCFPLTWLLGSLMSGLLGLDPVDAAKAVKTIDSISILGPSAFFAAFTGVLLWFSASSPAGWTTGSPTAGSAPPSRTTGGSCTSSAPPRCSGRAASCRARSPASRPTSRWVSCSDWRR